MIPCFEQSFDPFLECRVRFLPFAKEEDACWLLKDIAENGPQLKRRALRLNASPCEICKGLKYNLVLNT
jgi:hypothetical protein